MMSEPQLTFIHISDTHIHPSLDYTSQFADYPPLTCARALVENLASLPFQADFILHTGDVVYDPVESAYQTVQEIFSPIDIPIVYVAGNHDHNDGLQRHLMGHDDSEIIPNLHYEFEINGVQIVCVDSNGPAELPAGYVPDDQLAWLENLCTAEDDRPLIIAVHHNPLEVGVPWLDDWMRITNGNDFHQVIKKAKSRLVGVFHGHIHQSTSIYRDGILYTSATSPWSRFMSYSGMTDTTVDPHAKPGYNVVMVNQNQSFIRRYTFDISSSGA